MARLHHRRQATGRDHCADSGRLTRESGVTNSKGREEKRREEKRKKDQGYQEKMKRDRDERKDFFFEKCLRTPNSAR